MKCKDCIYFKRCVVLGVVLDMKHDKEADKNCRHFKNKADFMEVAHGEWLHVRWDDSDDIDPPHRVVKCSVCGNIGDRVTKYCPDCGAIMKNWGCRGGED
jgi:hypothetical protein